MKYSSHKQLKRLTSLTTMKLRVNEDNTSKKKLPDIQLQQGTSYSQNSHTQMKGRTNDRNQLVYDSIHRKSQ